MFVTVTVSSYRAILTTGSGHNPHTNGFSNMSKYPRENSHRKFSLEVFIAFAGSGSPEEKKKKT